MTDGALVEGLAEQSANLPLPAASLDAPAIPPLVITGLVVTKADLLAALRLYVPQVTDIAPLDGDRFLLGLRPPEPLERS